MSTTIDERVVEMRFDNKHFESNVSTTMSSIEKLKQSLKLIGVGKAAESEFSSYRSGFISFKDSVNKMWASWEHDIANRMKSLAKQLTIEPLTTGFTEYETKINSIQTIMSNTASKGTTMEDVTRVIGELNTYADKTIYNFAEMTRNIGTFTAAGVGLEESAAAIKGIANLAAASGSTSQQASTAMYQLSQALSTGTVRLMDWNSVVNAGMGGEKFQEALKATAREHGVAVDDIIKKNGSFRDSLQDGWLSADILNETLNKFTVDGAKKYAKSMVESGKYTQEQADALIKEAQAMEDAATKVKTFTQLWDTLKESAQSGWAQTWEILVGDFEEAKALLTEVSDVIGGFIGASADSRNALLEDWKLMGGRTELIEALKNAFEAILSVAKPIKEAFRDIFPPLTAKHLLDFTIKLKEFTGKLKLGYTASENLRRTFRGLFAILSIGKQLLSAVFKAITPLFGGVTDLGGGILGVTGAIGDWLVRLDEGINKMGIFDAAAAGIAKVLKALIKIIKIVVKAIGQSFVVGPLKVFGAFIEGFNSKFEEMGQNAESLGDTIAAAFESAGEAVKNCALFKVMHSIWTIVASIAKLAGKVVGTLVGGLVDRLANADFEGIMAFISTISIGALAAYIIKFVKGLSSIFDAIKGFKKSTIEIMNSFRECIEAWQSAIKASAISKIAKAVALLVAALIVLTFVDPAKLSSAISALTMVFGELLLGMHLLGKIENPMKGVNKTGFILIEMSVAILILASALKKISSLNPDELTVGLVGMVGLMLAVVAMAKQLTVSSDSARITKGAIQLVLIAAAIKILAGVCKDLSKFSWEELAKGVGGVSVMVLALSASARLMTTEKGTKAKGAMQIVAFALVLLTLGHVLKQVGSLSWETIAKGMTGIVGSMVIMTTVLAIMSKISSNKKMATKGSTELLKMSISLVVVGAVLKQVGSLSWEAIAKGLTGVAGALGVMVAVLAIFSLIGSTKKMSTKGSTELIKMSAALIIIGIALKQVGSMSWEAIGKGLVGLTGALIALVAVIAIMSSIGGTAAVGAAAILVMALALGVLTPVLLALGSMSWESIAKGLVTIAGAFVILGLAGLALSQVIPIILGLAASVAMIGAGILAAGIGLIAFGTGLSIVAAGLVAFAGAAWTAAKALPAIVTTLHGIALALVTGLLDGIISCVDKVGEVIRVLISTLIGVLVDNIPVIVEGLLKLIVQLLQALSEHIPTIIDLLIDIIIGIITTLADNLGPLAQAYAKLANALVKGIIDALGNIDSVNLDNALEAAGKLALVMVALSAAGALAPMALIGVISMIPVISALSLALSAIGALAQIPGLKWLVGEGGNLLQLVGTAIGKFVGGIVGGFMGGVSSQFPQIAKDLSSFMTNIKPFIDGAKGINSSVVGGVASLVGAVLLVTGASLLNRIASFSLGGSSISKFSTDIVLLGKGLKGFSDAVAGINTENMNAATSAAKALAEMTNSIPNSGGVVSWFVGDNSIAAFADELPKLGKGLKSFSDSVAGISPENLIAASTATKSLVELTDMIPNSGGVASWFAGENSIAKFGNELVLLGMGLKGFSIQTAGINTESMLAATNAAKALADMTAHIPNEGGIKSWFTGESSVARFSNELISLGMGLKNFSIQVVGINPESMIAAANAAKALAQMASYIPNEGGIKAWFTGESSIAKFGSELILLGMGLKGFGIQIAGINPESMTAASNAAKALAEMTSYVPNSGGLASWFTGENSVARFGAELILLGMGLKGFATQTAGINTENIIAASNAAKALAQMTSYIPSEGGVKAWFTGESSVSNFASKLPNLGKRLKSFSDNVAGINPENITAASKAAKTLAQMADSAPSDLEPMVEFGNKLKPFGEKLKGYFTQTAKITADSINASKNAINAVKNITGIDSGNIESASKAIAKLTESLKGVKGINKSTTDGFVKAVNNLGKVSVEGFTKSFNDISSKMDKIGKNAVGAFIKAVNAKKKDVTSAGKSLSDAFSKGITDNNKTISKSFTTLITSVVNSIRGKYTSMYSAGAYLASGLAAGISANSPTVMSRARALANSVASVMRKALKINSPSRVGYEIGDFFGLGFVNAISDYEKIAYDTSSGMANSATTGLGDAISKIQRFIDNDIDSQPTIRPVLDLSDVESNAGRIGGLLNGTSVGVMTNVGAISSMMGQNGRNTGNDDVVSALDKLRKDLGNMKSETYQINGVTYDDGSNIAEAVKSLIRATRMERRV